MYNKIKYNNSFSLDKKNPKAYLKKGKKWDKTIGITKYFPVLYKNGNKILKNEKKKREKNKSGKCGANGMKNSVQISGFRRNGNPTPKFQNFCSVCALHKTLLKK